MFDVHGEQQGGSVARAERMSTEWLREGCKAGQNSDHSEAWRLLIIFAWDAYNANVKGAPWRALIRDMTV